MLWTICFLGMPPEALKMLFMGVVKEQHGEGRKEHLQAEQTCFLEQFVLGLFAPPSFSH